MNSSTDRPTPPADPQHCAICGRVLDVVDDPMSKDCGGNCWGCIAKIEADGGWEPSVREVQAEIEAGWREDDGTAKRS